MSWSKNGVISELGSMDWSFSQPIIGPLWSQYVATYGLDFQDEGSDGHYAGLVPCGRYQIAAQVWHKTDACGTAILVHGYYDHIGLYGSLIRFCLQQGWNVVVFDLPGHGLSSGEEASIGSFQEYDEVFSKILQKVQEHLPGPLYAFGQSTGGAILINYILKRQLTPEQSPFAGVTLMAPLVRPAGWASGRVLHSLASLFVRRIKRKFRPNSANTEFLDFLQQDRLQPRHLDVRWVGALKQWVPYIEAQPASDIMLNIVQGDSDQTVDWQHNITVLQTKFPQSRLRVLVGGQHHLVNESPDLCQQMYQQIADWLH